MCSHGPNIKSPQSNETRLEEQSNVHNAVGIRHSKDRVARAGETPQPTITSAPLRDAISLVEDIWSQPLTTNEKLAEILLDSQPSLLDRYFRIRYFPGLSCSEEKLHVKTSNEERNYKWYLYLSFPTAFSSSHT
jgi:hypothetical protein